MERKTILGGLAITKLGSGEAQVNLANFFDDGKGAAETLERLSIGIGKRSKLVLRKAHTI